MHFLCIQHRTKVLEIPFGFHPDISTGNYKGLCMGSILISPAFNN